MATRSLGTGLSVPSVLAEHSAWVVRYALGSVQYRSMLEWSDQALVEAQAAYERIMNFIERAGVALGEQPERAEIAGVSADDLPADFVSAMNDDVNVSGATAAIFTAIRNGNTLLSKLDDRADGDAARAEVRSALVAVRAMLDALGLDPLAEPWAGAAGADGNGESREHDVLDALITEQLNARYWFGGLIGGSNLSTAILAAAVLALVIWYVMQKTSRGYEMKLTGQNERFARFIGIRTDRLVLVCMLLSGALCGLVGMFRVYGAEHLFRDSISRDYYFEGLMVAMIARYQPLAVVFLSLFFAALKIGAQGMELAAGVPNQIYLIIQTVVIFLMAAESGLFGALQNRVRKGKEAEKHA